MDARLPIRSNIQRHDVVGAIFTDKPHTQWQSDADIAMGATVYAHSGWEPFTIGNVVIGGSGSLDTKTLRHELSHVRQGEKLGGVGYIPTHALSWVAGAIVGGYQSIRTGEQFDFMNSVHRHGATECYWNDSFPDCGNP